MKKGLIILLAITLACGVLASFGNQESIVICYSIEQFRGDEMQRQLNEYFPGKNIIVTYMPTGKAAAKVYAEGENTEIDILIGLETGYLSKISDSLADVSGYSQVPFQPEFSVEQNGGRWITWEKQAGAFIVNTEVLERHGLEKPSSYQDLLKPEYKGLIAMPDPKSSGTGYFFYKSWVNAMGEERALDYVDMLHKNLKMFTESGSGPIKMLKQGEIAIGLGLTFQAVDERNSGQPLEIIFPDLGSPYSLTGASIVAGHDGNTDVQEVFSFLVNDFLRYDKENFSPEMIYDGQENKIPDYPGNIPYADMKGIQDNREKERLLAIWKY